MQIQDFSIWEPLLGGVLIGLASAALMYFNGKIAGISGIFRGLLVPQSGAIAWRAMFIGGMVLAGLVMVLVSPQIVCGYCWKGHDHYSCCWSSWLVSGFELGVVAPVDTAFVESVDSLCVRWPRSEYSWLLESEWFGSPIIC